MWAGMPLLPDEAMKRYDVDAVLTFDELKSGKSLVQMLEKQKVCTAMGSSREDVRLDLVTFDEIAVPCFGSGIC